MKLSLADKSIDLIQLKVKKMVSQMEYNFLSHTWIGIMTKQQKIILYVLILLSLLLFAAFIIPNLTGAKDATMLSVFEHDEYAQYPNVIHMLQQGDSFKATLHNFLVYLHYYYGYPFYFFSAITLLPLKWILGADWATHTQLLVAWLRQFINVLPMLLAVVILIRDQFKSKSPWKALLTFLLLMTLPAVVRNNLWWHPDSLLTLFAVLTIFFLISDKGRFGKYFYLSGFTCALAIGAKILGVLFVVTYASFLLYGLVTKKITLKKTILSALLFLVVLVVSVVATNPLLLLPIERGEIIAIFKANLSQSSQGFYVAGNGTSNKLNEISQMIREYYGGILLFIAALVSTIIGLIRKENRLKYLVILTWVAGFMGYFVIFAATLRPHYFIPAMLPLYATLLDWFPDDLKTLFKRTDLKVNGIKLLACLAVILMMVVTIGINSVQTAADIEGTSRREESSPSLALFRTFQTDYLPSLPPNTPLLIYRDWRAYVAENPHWRVIYNWNLGTYGYIEENKPDILFIEYDNMHYFSDASKLAIALDKDTMQQMYDFYSDALHENITGYHLLYKDSYGSIFATDSLYKTYFQK